MANYEKYSSTLKDFQLLASNQYPTTEWLNLGTYTAEWKLGEQQFNITETGVHTRYLKIRFLTHYGTEELCTYSQIKVHGLTVIASFKEEVERSDSFTRDMIHQLTHEHLEVDKIHEMLEDEAVVNETIESVDENTTSILSIMDSAENVTDSIAAEMDSVPHNESIQTNDAIIIDINQTINKHQIKNDSISFDLDTVISPPETADEVVDNPIRSETPQATPIDTIDNTTGLPSIAKSEGSEISLTHSLVGVNSSEVMNSTQGLSGSPDEPSALGGILSNIVANDILKSTVNVVKDLIKLQLRLNPVNLSSEETQPIALEGSSNESVESQETPSNELRPNGQSDTISESSEDKVDIVQEFNADPIVERISEIDVDNEKDHEGCEVIMETEVISPEEVSVVNVSSEMLDLSIEAVTATPTLNTTATSATSEEVLDGSETMDTISMDEMASANNSSHVIDESSIITDIGDSPTRLDYEVVEDSQDLNQSNHLSKPMTLPMSLRVTKPSMGLSSSLPIDKLSPIHDLISQNNLSVDTSVPSITTSTTTATSTTTPATIQYDIAMSIRNISTQFPKLEEIAAKVKVRRPMDQVETALGRNWYGGSVKGTNQTLGIGGTGTGNMVPNHQNDSNLNTTSIYPTEEDVLDSDVMMLNTTATDPLMQNGSKISDHPDVVMDNNLFHSSIPPIIASTNLTHDPLKTIPAPPLNLPDPSSSSSSTSSSSYHETIKYFQHNHTVPNGLQLNSTTCIDALKYKEFYNKMLIKMAKTNGSNSAGDSTESALYSGSKDSNVFRILLQKFKTLEVNHAILEAFMTQLNECYKLSLKELRHKQQIHHNLLLQQSNLTVFTTEDEPNTPQYIDHNGMKQYDNDTMLCHQNETQYFQWFPWYPTLLSSNQGGHPHKSSCNIEMISNKKDPVETTRSSRSMVVLVTHIIQDFLVDGFNFPWSECIKNNQIIIKDEINSCKEQLSKFILHHVVAICIVSGWFICTAWVMCIGIFILLCIKYT